MTDDQLAQAKQLIAQGLSQRQAAEQLGIPRSTLGDRLRAETPVPVQRPVQTVDTGAEHSVDTDAVQRLDHLEGEVQGLMHIVRSLVERIDTPPVQTPVQITTLPLLPKGKAIRWNLWIHEAIREEITRLAAERDLSPSQLVQELLWTVLNERRSSTP